MHHGGHHDPHHMPTHHMPVHHGGHDVHVMQPQVMAYPGQPTMGGMVIGQPMPQTTVVMVQGQQAHFQPGDWVESFCGCFSDIPTCLMSCFCPCIQYGQNHEAIHKDGCLIQAILFACLATCHLQCLIHMGLRGHIRHKFSIFGGGLEDFCLTCCCPCCALAQEAREITHRRHEAAAKGIPW